MDSKSNSRIQFAENLKYYMKRDEKRQKDLSNDLGIANSLVSEWVKGKKYPRIENMKKLADYFNVTISDLVDDKEKDLFYSLPVYSKTMEINDNSNAYRTEYQDAFQFHIENNHMEPKFEKDDIVVAEKKTTYTEDCFVIAKRKNLLAVYKYNHKNKTIETLKTKKVYSVDNTTTLVAEIIELRRKPKV